MSAEIGVPLRDTFDHQYYTTGFATASAAEKAASLSGGLAYETVAAGQTNQVLGATGAAGDLLAGLLIVPATTAPGPVSIREGSGPSIMVFVGGDLYPISSTIPFFIPLGILSLTGAWKVTTSADVSVIAVGSFT
jgi:hypothetical protein